MTTTRIGEAPTSVVDPHNHPSPSFNAKTRITAGQGLADSVWAIDALPGATLIGLTFAALGMAATGAAIASRRLGQLLTP